MLSLLLLTVQKSSLTPLQLLIHLFLLIILCQRRFIERHIQCVILYNELPRFLVGFRRQIPVRIIWSTHIVPGRRVGVPQMTRLGKGKGVMNHGDGFFQCMCHAQDKALQLLNGGWHVGHGHVVTLSALGEHVAGHVILQLQGTKVWFVGQNGLVGIHLLINLGERLTVVTVFGAKAKHTPYSIDGVS